MTRAAQNAVASASWRRLGVLPASGDPAREIRQTMITASLMCISACPRPWATAHRCRWLLVFEFTPTVRPSPSMRHVKPYSGPSCRSRPIRIPSALAMLSTGTGTAVTPCLCSSLAAWPSGVTCGQQVHLEVQVERIPLRERLREPDVPGQRLRAALRIWSSNAACVSIPSSPRQPQGHGAVRSPR